MATPAQGIYFVLKNSYVPRNLAAIVSGALMKKTAPTWQMSERNS
jgi:hypothetical protein